MFDIDGTLLATHGAGRRAIRQALLDELGTTGPIDTLRFDGKTDPQIVMELMRAADPPISPEPARIAAVCERYASLLEMELASSTIGVSVLPGVIDLLDALERDGGAMVGLLTGNVAAGATLKLRAGGLDPLRFRVGAFGSDSAHRPELPAFAVERAAPLAGRQFSGHDVVILGDTPADITCGAGLGARALGVATGSYTSGDLEAAGAFRVFDNLAATTSVMRAIFE